MSGQGKYIYGIIEETQPERFSFLGVADAEVYTINLQRLAAVVSDTELNEIDPTRKNVLAHTVVQDQLLKSYTFLPMSFGMIAGGNDQVVNVLRGNYQSLTQELARLSGKIEVELKVFWDQQAMIMELQSESKELVRLKARLNTTSSLVEKQNLLMEAGMLVERVALDWKTRYAGKVYDVLKGMSADAKLNNTIGVKNILNASFLIDQSHEADFQKEVYVLDSQYKGKVNFKYVGPLPPYNFINLKLELAK